MMRHLADSECPLELVNERRRGISFRIGQVLRWLSPATVNSKQDYLHVGAQTTFCRGLSATVSESVPASLSLSLSLSLCRSAPVPLSLCPS
eukprot:2008337-Rhodomonas_salina.1